MNTKSKDYMSDAYDETQEVKELCNYLIRHIRETNFAYHSQRARQRLITLLEREIDYQVSQFN